MITIQWNTGQMTIDPEKFFPCSLKTLKSLKKKVIDIACPWSHRDEVIAQIRDHLRERELRITTLRANGSTAY